MYENEKTPFNLCLNNPRSPYVVILPKTNIFNKHAHFTLIESIPNTNKPKEAIQELLKRQENFWIRTLETLQPHGLDDDLNPE